MTPKTNCEICPVRTRGAFCDLTKDELGELMRARVANTYRKHSVIFYEGNPPMGLFGIWSGKVKLYNHAANGRTQIARLAKPGDLLGYRALFGEEPYAATAEVIEDATICFLDRTLAYSILRRNTGVALRIMEYVCRDLRVAERRMHDLVRMPVVERTAALLLELERDFGEPAPRGTRLAIDLTREEMAEMIGTTAESLIRTLSEFRQKDWIELDGHRVLVKESSALAKLIPQDV
ncbi:MAG: Crp/Fnr family transcriptional regulator [Candidatus Coatesbacteria bacterium]